MQSFTSGYWLLPESQSAEVMRPFCPPSSSNWTFLSSWSNRSDCLCCCTAVSDRSGGSFFGFPLDFELLFSSTAYLCATVQRFALESKGAIRHFYSLVSSRSCLSVPSEVSFPRSVLCPTRRFLT